MPVPRGACGGRIELGGMQLADALAFSACVGHRQTQAEVCEEIQRLTRALTENPNNVEVRRPRQCSPEIYRERLARHSRMLPPLLAQVLCKRAGAKIAFAEMVMDQSSSQADAKPIPGPDAETLAELALRDATRVLALDPARSAPSFFAPCPAFRRRRAMLKQAPLLPLVPAA